MSGNKYGVQFQRLTKRIAVGRLNKAHTMFVANTQEDHTERIVDEVIEYVLAVFDGQMEVQYGDKARVEVIVRRFEAAS